MPSIYNQAAHVERTADCGLLWEEKITNDVGTLIVNKFSSVRIRATGATTVTVDSVRFFTMQAGEIIHFCVGAGDTSDDIETVNLVIGAANAYVQVARDLDRK